MRASAIATSVCLGDEYALYELSHGTWDGYEGTDTFNPLSAILLVELMLRHSFGLVQEADAVVDAIQAVLGRWIQDARHDGGRVHPNGDESPDRHDRSGDLTISGFHKPVSHGFEICSTKFIGGKSDEKSTVPASGTGDGFGLGRLRRYRHEHGQHRCSGIRASCGYSTRRIY